MKKIIAKNVRDIFCGKYHSFYMNKHQHIYAWGMNNHGQLGLNTRTPKTTPTHVSDMDPYEGDYFVSLTGGEHHTIGLMKSGCVYCFGNNEEGQIGLGDLFGDFYRKKREREAEELQKLEALKLNSETGVTDKPA